MKLPPGEWIVFGSIFGFPLGVHNQNFKLYKLFLQSLICLNIHADWILLITNRNSLMSNAYEITSIRLYKADCSGKLECPTDRTRGLLALIRDTNAYSPLSDCRSSTLNPAGSRHTMAALVETCLVTKAAALSVIYFER